MYPEEQSLVLVTAEEVSRIASLVRLRLTCAERERMAPEMSRIVDYMGLLHEVDTTGVPPLRQPEIASRALRRDVVRCGLAREEVLAAAPRARLGFFSVPKVLAQGRRCAR